MNGLRMVEHEPRQWRVLLPPVVQEQATRFQQAKARHTTHPVEAEQLYRQIMVACGERHLDAVSHLGMLLNARSPGTGLTYLVQAFTQARLLFPKAFEEGRDVLRYECAGNGFVLNAYYAMGLELQKARKWADALALFEFLVKINPQDHHGASRWLGPLRQQVATAAAG
jgi:tetratricopeptide (TPR) repeat protein